MSLPRIAVLDDYQEVALGSADWSGVTARAEVTVFTAPIGDPDDVVRRLHPFEIVVAMRERTPFPAAVLERLPGLRLLVTTGMANAAVDLAAAARAGVVVCGTASSGQGTAELTWGLMLALVRAIPQEDARVRSGGWQRTVGSELAGRTLGLLGLGRVGGQVARYARAFDMNLIAWSHNLTAQRAADHGAALVSRADLFRLADIVSVHVRLSQRTAGLVGAAELALLGPRGYLINTSRGPVVDEAALAAALRDGVIAGAAADVFGTEPVPAGDPLLTAPHTVLTPHLGYVTTQAYAVFYREIVEDIVAWLDGSPIRVLG